MDILARWRFIFVADTLRYAVPALLAFSVLWIWKWDELAHRRIQLRRPSTRAFTREVGYSLLTAVIFATVGTATFYLGQIGVLHTYGRIDDHGWVYWAFSIVIAIVVHDAYFYWTHRAMHHPKLFKLVHRTHHLSTSPSPLAAYAFGPIEAVVLALIVPLLLLVMPMHESAIIVFLGYMIVMNVIGHNGHELYPRWFARSRWTGWSTTSTHHNLHHRDFHGNYGLYFTWWDRLMGTERKDYVETFERIASRAHDA